MIYRSLAACAAALAAALAVGQANAATVTVNAQDDLYNAGGGALDGLNPVAINVTGDSSVTFSVSTGQTVTVNNANYNDADGVGSVSGETISGANGISGLTAPTAGFLAGAFEGATLGATPASLTFTSSNTNFASLSPSLQQAFFIGDGLTGDGSGSTQTFYVPKGATTLYLGLTDACSYNGGPSCYGDNVGSFSVTVNGVGSTVPTGVPEPAAWTTMLLGFGCIGTAMRRNRRRDGAQAAVA